MPKNMGAFDRVLRAVVVAPAAIAVALTLGAGTLVGIVLFVVAGIMLATAVSGFCPAYTLLGIATGPQGVHRVGRGLHPGRA
jgi:hypothetical protein